MRGNYDEARVLGEAALPPAKAGDNVAYLQRLAGARSGAKSAASRAEGGADPAAKGPPQKANASLPQPTYQLGGPPRAD